MNPVAPLPVINARLLAALGAISAAVTAHQIGLMQVLGWMHWHHFAYMIVAIALLGFGIAGTALSLAREALLRRTAVLLPWLLLAAAVSIPLGVRLAQLEALAVDLPLVFFAPANAWRLAALCGLLLPPFFCGGLATGLLLTAHAVHAGRIYAASLAGAGAGGLIGLASAARIEPPRLPVAVGLVALIAAVCLWRQLSSRQRGATLLVAALLGTLWLVPGELTSSQFKPLRRVLDLPEARIIASRPSIHGWVQVVAAPALRPTPALSFDFQGAIPAQPALFVNGLPYGSVPDAAALREGNWLEHTTDAAAFIHSPQRVLLLENGPGGWAALATRHGAQTVTVVEPNRAVVELLTSGAAPTAAEWTASSVEVLVADARTVLNQEDAPVDLIRFPTVGALGGSTGLASAGEQFLFTREAFIDAWRRLAPDGIIAVTAWMDFPERNSLRLLATLAEALEAEGAPPRTHLAAVRGWATVTFLARRAPWTAAAAGTLRQFSATRGFDPLLLPGVTREEQQATHMWQNPAFFDVVDAIVDGPREPVYQDYPFLLRPATDQRPYFSQFIRVTETGRLREVFGARAMPFFELGSLVVGVTFVLLAALGVVCIVLPLVRLGWAAGGKTAVLLYFGGLGAGYMLVEIGAMLQAIAWLGSPVRAAAAVITTLLLASGLGSLWSERLRADPRTLRRALMVIAALVVAGGALLALLSSLARTWAAPAQIAALLVIVALPGAAMGAAFPLGLRRLAASSPAHVPWAWAINGCVSVATPAGATLLAMNNGFNALFAAAAAAYLVALLATFFNGASATQSG